RWEWWCSSIRMDFYRNFSGAFEIAVLQQLFYNFIERTSSMEKYNRGFSILLQVAAEQCINLPFSKSVRNPHGKNRLRNRCLRRKKSSERLLYLIVR
ncbi:hypothetical protein, partial [Acinetobacter baumannii]|uniref:hypothetical protein n=1 Tax=Acinetobacter baumannii TaxID=470 RepID=UPI003391C62E